MSITALFVFIALVGSICNSMMRIKLSYVFWLVSNVYLLVHNFLIHEYSQGFLFSAYLITSIVGLRNAFKSGGGWLDKFSA